MNSQLRLIRAFIGLITIALVANLPSVFAADKNSNRGKLLLQKKQCMVCHSIKGSGGCLAPPFDGIGARRSKGFLMARITKEKKEEDRFFDLYEAQELMPHVRLPRKETTPIVAYLLTLAKPAEKPQPVKHEIKTDNQKRIATKIKTRLESKLKPQKEDKEIALGKRLVAEKGCQACHSIQKTGGTFGPKLDHIGSRKSITFIANQIIAAEIRPLTEGKNKIDRMPAQGLSLDEIQAIAKFLKSLK